jgi:hypothetical protein
MDVLVMLIEETGEVVTRQSPVPTDVPTICQ